MFNIEDYIIDEKIDVRSIRKQVKDLTKKRDNIRKVLDGSTGDVSELEEKFYLNEFTQTCMTLDQIEKVLKKNKINLEARATRKKLNDEKKEEPLHVRHIADVARMNKMSQEQTEELNLWIKNNSEKDKGSYLVEIKNKNAEETFVHQMKALSKFDAYFKAFARIVKVDQEVELLPPDRCNIEKM